MERARQLLAASRDDRLSNLFAVAIAMGCRPRELASLRWDDVDLDAGTTTFRQTHHGPHRRSLIRRRRGRPPRRSVRPPVSRMTPPD
ncbi:MAG: hypothetical protein AVDCRST_MAG33-1488 [uncultured Thermomicrobiales bacterium]|uniref:Tyr recombinase domain-containing protein n=1 Tax=uncultured Thermomicrobiales bacterium TaxID=1645740 RepID=A0A6J4UUV8_9BACT|nr:MAG: hypothetical protein AVDCRST_MAG33-1488 [uncultured Thermomicrobiales bacterium]